MTRAEKVVSFACAFIVLIHAIASFYPKERLWGVNHLAYVPLAPRWIMIILAFLVLIPAVNTVVYDALSRFFNRAEKNLRRIARYHKYILFSLGSTIPFWVFRARTHLLGDGHLRGKEIWAGTRFPVTEPLDFHLHAWAHRLLKLDAYQTYALLSCLAGAFFVFLVLSLSRFLGRENREKALAFLILVTMGSVQLFFGYVESYSLVYVGIMAYFLFSFLYLRGKCGLILPSLILLISISLHLSAACFLPSLIYLHLARSQNEERRFSFKKILNVILILLLVGGAFVVLSVTSPDAPSVTSYSIPLTGNENDPYSLFSYAHLVDIINEQLLLSPVGIILWAMLFVFQGRIDFKDQLVVFLAIAAVFSLGFALLMNPKLGYARDWDLFSFTGLSCTLLGIYLAFGSFRQAKIKELNYVILALASTALLSTLPWVYVNAQEDTAVERFEALLQLDSTRSGYGHEILAYYYRERGLVNEEIEEWKKALSLTKNDRYAGSLGMGYLQLGRRQEAVAAFRMAVRLNPNSAENRNNLGNALYYIGKYDEATDQYQMSIKIDSTFFMAYNNLGGLWGDMGQYEDALKMINEAIRLNPDYFEAYINLANVCSRMGEPNEVIPFFQAYLKRNPEDYPRVREFLRKMDIDID